VRHKRDKKGGGISTDNPKEDTAGGAGKRKGTHAGRGKYDHTNTGASGHGCKRQKARVLTNNRGGWERQRETHLNNQEKKNGGEEGGTGPKPKVGGDSGKRSKTGEVDLHRIKENSNKPGPGEE